MGSKLLAVDFEVFGRVQGVFFRKYTSEEARKLHLRGWCRNTAEGTVKGTLQGDAKKVAQMKTWLREVGSPSSRIEKCDFQNEREIDKLEFEDFQIKK